MLDDLLSLFGEVREEPQKAETRKPFYVVLRIRTTVKAPSGKPYYVFILKGSAKSIRIYSENRNWFGEQLFRSKRRPERTVPIKDILDDGRASGWLHDKLAGLI